MPSKETQYRSVRREPNRRRAKDLADQKLREIQSDFRRKRNSLEVAQDHLLPRSEAVDGLLIRVEDDLRSVRQELSDLRREMGVADHSTCRPFVIRKFA